jgi:hypothetical protein
MSEVEAATAPTGLSLEEFKSMSLDAGEWLWGTVSGAFNEKATLSQIVVDALIGMIPVVGDVTAARDLIAVLLGLCDDPKKREQKLQWVLLVVFIFALIPVVGGAVKGVGRLLIKATGEAAALMDASARGAHFLAAAQDIVAFLDRLGAGNAERWLKELRFAEHQAKILQALNGLVIQLHKLLERTKGRLNSVLPKALQNRIDGLMKSLMWLKDEIVQRIPDAIKQLDQDLREIQAFIHSGGQTTSKSIAEVASTGTPAPRTSATPTSSC